MWILLFVLWIALFIACFISSDKIWETIAFIPFCGAVFSLIAIVWCLTYVIDGRVIDDKIAMYSEENTKIETSIDQLVSKYMDYESNTLTDFKDEDSITLVSLYPELKVDELVKTQIQTYQENNAKIKELKTEKINISGYKWWLYFGK